MHVEITFSRVSSAHQQQELGNTYLRLFHLVALSDSLKPHSWRHYPSSVGYLARQLQSFKNKIRHENFR